MNKKTILRNVGVIALAVTVCGAAWAGADGGAAGGDEFSEIWDLLRGWTQGVLGRIIALGALLVGIAFGLVRQSVVAAVIGISMAVVLQYGPDVIEGILTASGEGAPVEIVAGMDNGMQQVAQIDLTVLSKQL